MTSVAFELRASGSVSDYTLTIKSEIAAAVATAASVDVSAVSVTVAAGSVLIGVRITTLSPASAAAVQANVATATASPQAAQAMLASVTSTPIAVSAITIGAQVVALSPPSPPPGACAAAGGCAPVITIHKGHLWHGILMIVAWGLIFPAGAVMPRFWRSALPDGRWLRAHRWVQTGGVVVMLAGVAVAVAFTHADGVPHFASTHSAMGLGITVVALLQPMLALVRPTKPQTGERPSWARCAWQLKHAVIGYTLLILGIVQLISGVRLSYGLELSYYVYGGALTVATLVIALGVAIFRRSSSMKLRGLQAGAAVKPGVASKATSVLEVGSTPSALEITGCCGPSLPPSPPSSGGRARVLPMPMGAGGATAGLVSLT